MTTTGARADSQPPGGSRNLFVRNATGLVRELSAFDAFNLVFSAVLIPVGITEVMAFTPVFWPHANMLLSFLLATPLVATCGLVYLYYTMIMPRSGGDYVWVSRTLSPFFGFFSNFSLTFVFLTWIAFNFTYMLSVMGPAAAYVGGWHAGWLTAPDKAELMVIATVLTALFTALMIFGVRWGATLFGMIYSFQVYTGFQWTGYFAGEIRDVRRTAVTSILGGLLLSAVGYVAGVALIYKYFGFDFFGAAVFGAFGGGAAHWNLTFQPYLPALVNFLPGPHWLLVFVALCFVAAILWWTPTGFMLGTRNMFAWSFDRLAPEKLTTPLIAIVYYIGVRLYRRRQGMPLAQAFAEIPPE